MVSASTRHCTLTGNLKFGACYPASTGRTP